jgi:hypothetical protein
MQHFAAFCFQQQERLGGGGRSAKHHRGQARAAEKHDVNQEFCTRDHVSPPS